MTVLVDLVKHKIVTVSRIFRLLRHVVRHGIQLSNVVHMCDDMEVIAIQHNNQSITYGTLFSQIRSVSGFLCQHYAIKQGSNVLVIADNSPPSVILIFSLSALGCNIHVLAPGKDEQHFARTTQGKKYEFIFSAIEKEYSYFKAAGIHYITARWLDAISATPYAPFVFKKTTLAIFTSGSTGIAKQVKRSNTLWQYLMAISDLVKTMSIHQHQNFMLPVPIYHSYGLSALFLGLMMTKTIHLINKFDANRVADEILRHRITMIALIPQMLQQLLTKDIQDLKCIISCADLLPTQVLKAAQHKFGNIIYNLYGTSETGICTIATPAMLSSQPSTIGRAIKGCKLKLVNESGQTILYVKSAFNSHNGYTKTGDIVSVDEQGWYYHHGRMDHMLVVNGVNIYPTELLHMIYRNEGVQHATVVPFKDAHGFKRLKVIIYRKDDFNFSEEQFKEWWYITYGSKFLPSVVDFETDQSKIKLLE